MNNERPSTKQVREIVAAQIEQLYDRSESQPHPEALDHLHRELVQAAKAYNVGPKEQRQAVCDALMATSDYLRHLGFTDAALVPLDRVVWALVDLCKHNRPDPLFCEKMRKTKPRRSTRDAIVQGQLAAMVEAWLLADTQSDEGESNELRLARAARAFGGRYFGQLEGKNLSSAQRFQREADLGSPMLRAYREMKEIIESEAECAGGGKSGLRFAVATQILALNMKADAVAI